MKNITLLLFVLIVFTSCFNRNKYVIEGQIENSAGTVLYLQKLIENDPITIDSFKLDSKGKFLFKGDKLTEPTFFVLKFNERNFITLLADSAEKIVVYAKSESLENSYELKNAIASSSIQLLNKKMTKLNSDLSSLTSTYKQANGDNEQAAIEFQEAYAERINEYKANVAQFIMENPRSFASYYALFQKTQDGMPLMDVMDKSDHVYFATVATSLNLFYPKSLRAKQFYNYVLNAKKQMAREKIANQLMASATELSFPDINLPTINGEKIQLSSLKGKVILLSFWAAWDENSRAENRNLKRLYAKYKNKNFEIYQVSLDKSKVLWQSTVEADQLPWIQVSDLQYTNSVAAKAYNISRLPSNYLISSSGDIIGKNLIGNRLAEKLEKVLN